MDDYQNTPQRRRWYQFGLGTMFMVMTVFALWLGSELRFVRERQQHIRMLAEGGHTFYSLAEKLKADAQLDFQTIAPESYPRISFWREWLGDQAFTLVSADGTIPGEVARVYRLFSEANLGAFNTSEPALAGESEMLDVITPYDPRVRK
jgi:hypothetical protein